MFCRHCQRRPIKRPRGLCRACYGSLDIRLAYPPISIFGRRGFGLGNSARQPPFPTTAQPGSPEKIAVLQERARQGYLLFHPQDATGYEQPALSVVG